MCMSVCKIMMTALPKRYHVDMGDMAQKRGEAEGLTDGTRSGGWILKRPATEAKPRLRSLPIAPCPLIPGSTATVYRRGPLWYNHTPSGLSLLCIDGLCHMSCLARRVDAGSMNHTTVTQLHPNIIISNATCHPLQQTRLDLVPMRCLRPTVQGQPEASRPRAAMELRSRHSYCCA